MMHGPLNVKYTVNIWILDGSVVYTVYFSENWNFGSWSVKMAFIPYVHFVYCQICLDIFFLFYSEIH